MDKWREKKMYKAFFLIYIEYLDPKNVILFKNKNKRSFL